MFRIEIVLADQPCDLSGLEALDMRRRLGLRDASYLKLRGEEPVSRWVNVDESFARRYFRRMERDARREVTLDQLMPGDVLDRPGYDFNFSDGDKLTDDRVIELFIAGS